MISKKITVVPPSKTMEVNSKAKEMIRKGIDVVNLTAGEPDFKTPEPILEEAKKAMDEGYTKYTDARGIIELREKIAEFYGRKYKMKISHDEIVITNGAKQGIYNTLFSILDGGDEVIILTPAWVSYVPQVLLCGGKPVKVETRFENGFIPDVDEIEKNISRKTKAIILNSPNNPTGAVYPPDVLRDISKLADKYGLFVLSDEIYSELVYESTYHSTFEFFNRDRLIVVNGFSKSHAMTGWRIGYVIAPKRISEAIAKIQSHTTSNVNSITQRAVLKAFEVDIGYMKEEFRRRKDVVSEGLKRAGLDFVEPKGAFYFFFRTPYDDTIFCNDLLLEKKVALVPGSSFEYPSFARLSFATSLDTLKEGMRRIYEFLR